MNIEIEKEVYDKLLALANSMVTQDPRGTRMPHIFQIRDWKKVYDADLNGDVHIFLDRTEGNEIETADELIEYLNDNEIEFDEIQIKDMWDDDFDFGLPDWIEEYAPRLHRHSYSLEPFYVNSFLTAKAAQEHLDRNYYHYHKDADVYLNHAWRNPEAELVSEFLLSLINQKLYI
jgi:hypothetical protein